MKNDRLLESAVKATSTNPPSTPACLPVLFEPDQDPEVGGRPYLPPFQSHDGKAPHWTSSGPPRRDWSRCGKSAGANAVVLVSGRAAGGGPEVGGRGLDTGASFQKGRKAELDKYLYIHKRRSAPDFTLYISTEDGVHYY